MDIVFDYISVTTFWRIMLFLHFTMAVALMVAITLQSLTVLIPVRQQVNGQIGYVARLLPPASYAATVVALYVPTFLLGAWVRQISHLR